jgi:arylsulfatase A-like enzyme
MGIMDTSVPFLTDADGNPQRFPLNDFYRTPHMERLAAMGIRFNQFCAMSVCSPTRISIMTGQNAARHHTTNWINPEKNNAGPSGPPDWNWNGLSPASVTLPRLLQQAGYRTIHVGKGHFASADQPAADPRQIGFDVSVAGAAFGAPGSYFATKKYSRGKNGQIHAVPGLDKYHGTDTFLTEALTLEAKHCLDDAVQSGKPFFLYFAQYAVHAPFESDPRFAAHYTDSGRPAAAQAFATLIEGMDHSLGEVLDHLEKLGIAENTIIFFLGDNGTDAPLGDEHAVACAAPLRGKKGAHYEGGMRVPFIAAWARPAPQNQFQQRLTIPHGAIQTQLASVCDLFPTILQLAGAAAPADDVVDGFPLQKLLTGQPDPSRSEEFLMNYPHSPHRSNYFTSYRNGDWKVIYHYFPSAASENSHYQLYHLKQDPYESRNLADDNPAELKRMMQGLIDSMERHAAQYPVAADGAPLKPQMP